MAKNNPNLNIMKIGKFELVNSEKVNRAIYGEPRRGGIPEGGVGKDASDAEILAAYDKLAGLIMVGKRRVKTGSFWNFEDGKPHDEPQVVFEIRGIDGKIYEVADGEEAPLEVQVAEKEADEKPSKTKRSSKKSIEDTDDEDESDDESSDDDEESEEEEVEDIPAKPSKTSKSKKGKKSVEDEE